MAEYINIDKPITLTATIGIKVQGTVRQILDENDGVYETDDVHPVKHGKWMPIIEGNEYGDVYQCGCYCSECGETLQSEPNYCPNCGSRNTEDATDV